MVGPYDQFGHRDPRTCRSRQHEPGRALPLALGLEICSSCRDLAEETLADLPTLFDLCAYALDVPPTGTWDRTGDPTGPVLCEAVVSVRSEILGVLSAWCGHVSGERRTNGPDELTIRRLVGFLGIHLHWLCQHPAAADLVDDLASLSAAVSAALRPEATHRVAVGTCPHPGCGRPVCTESRRAGELPYEVACDAGHVWTPERWRALGGGRDGEPRPENAG